MDAIRTSEEAGVILKARGLSIAGKAALELESQAREAIRNSKVLTEHHVEKLEICNTLTTQHYVIFLINDTSGPEPVGLLWAYAEKLQDDSGFLFSYGTGSSKSTMKIHGCALLSFDGRKHKAEYKFGGELIDEKGDISFKAQLTNEQYASMITDIVNVDGGGRKRIAISTTEDRLSELTAISQSEPKHPVSSSGPGDPFADDEPVDPHQGDDGEGA